MKFSVKNFLEKTLNEKLKENPKLFKDFSCVYELCVDDDYWTLDLSKNGSRRIESGPVDESDCRLDISADDFEKLAKGKLNIPLAVVIGKIKITGSKSLALKLVELFK